MMNTLRSRGTAADPVECSVRLLAGTRAGHADHKGVYSGSAFLSFV